MSIETDRREFTRAVVRVDAEIAVNGEVIQAKWTRDVSMKGLLAGCTQIVAIGTPCEVTLHLDGREAGVRIQASGHVARCNGESLAVEFTTLHGQSSYEHLSRLMMHSADEPEEIERELAAHVGIKRSR